MNTYRQHQRDILDGKLAVVTDIERFSVHDGPGIRTMVFFKGCPLRCQWCQNPETWHRSPELMYFRDNCIGCGNCAAACPSGALRLTEEGVTINQSLCLHCGTCAKACYPEALKVSGKLMSVDDVVEQVVRDKVFYQTSNGGVTLSGGECTTYPTFITELLKRLQSFGIHTAIETCGFCNKAVFEQIIKYVDLLLFDIKVPREGRDKQYTGKSCAPILSNLRRARDLGKSVILRYPMIPTVNDDTETLHAITDIASQTNITELHLLPFHQMGSNKWHALSRNYLCEEKEEPSDDDILRVKNELVAGGLNVCVGGAG